MIANDMQDYIQVYSLFSFRDGRKEPGILINKYNRETLDTDYYFIHQVHMHAYKSAFEKFDRDACASLCEKLNIGELLSIRPVSLSDYKIIMQLLDERRDRQTFNG